MLLIEQIQIELKRQNKSIVILDDDPTGGQTVHNVPVLTEWTQAAIQKEFEQKTPIFFILTNSRSLTTDIAKALNFEIGKNIKTVAKASNRDFYIISRGDSTLRGHFFDETDSLAQGLGWNTERGYITALIPAFFEGNRFTKNDIHYWKNGEDWIPVGETPYAKDATFGYKNSDLKLWVEEKTKGKTKASEVISFDPNRERVDFIAGKLKKIQPNKTLIVNALNYNDVEIFALAALRSEKRILYRTSASFVRAFAGITHKPLLTNKDLIQNNNEKIGGLIIVGSHVPKTTAQLAELLKTNIESIELDVTTLFTSNSPKIEIEIEKILRGGKNVVLYTSRQVITGKNEAESLQLSVKVSEKLVSIVKDLKVRPAFLIAKGGITSSDIATKGLGVKRAIVLGQIVAGVPVWQLDDETKFPNMPYIIFPGNVGSNEDLKNVYEILK
jgi:uncharacterized protein YgbK (DUF1537 family)